MLDNFTCVYCGYVGADVTIDHFIPVSAGGPDAIQNLVTACLKCNLEKGSRAPYEARMFARFGRYSYVLGKPRLKPQTRPLLRQSDIVALYQEGRSRNQIAALLTGTKAKRLAIIEAALAITEEEAAARR